MKKIVNLMTGDRSVFEKTYAKLYGKQDCSGRIQSMKSGLLKKYGCLSIVMFVAIALFAIYESRGQTSRTHMGNEREISIYRPPVGENALRIPMTLEAAMQDDEKVVRNIVILVRPQEAEMDIEIAIEEADEQEAFFCIEEEINRLVNAINNSDYDEKVVLPAELAGGVSLAWQESHHSALPMLLILFPVIGIAIYQSRYAKLKAIEKEARESIIRELPEFINKLVLLLGAGLVLTSAFDRILENDVDKGKEEKSYFYLQLSQIGRSMRETNDSMIGGFKEFAGRSGVRELTRAANIIADNASKGAELAEKLQGESELLWLTKKKLAEEKGKLAETKMTFPLMILLLVLIMITIAPALLEM